MTPVTNGTHSPAADPVDPDLVAGAVASCTSVARLSGGMAGEVATYLPGRRVTGVRVRADELQVHVVGVYGIPVSEIGTEVRAALAPLVGGLPVAVSIDDLALPGENSAGEQGQSW